MINFSCLRSMKYINTWYIMTICIWKAARSRWHKEREQGQGCPSSLGGPILSQSSHAWEGNSSQKGRCDDPSQCLALDLRGSGVFSPVRFVSSQQFQEKKKKIQEDAISHLDSCSSPIITIKFYFYSLIRSAEIIFPCLLLFLWERHLEDCEKYQVHSTCFLMWPFLILYPRHIYLTLLCL